MASARESGRAVALAAVEALGCGLDLTADYRLKYRKGPLLNLQLSHTKDLLIPGGITIPNVSRDVKCDKGERMRFTSEVMKFQQMSQWFNKNAFVEGKIPLGFFNAMFDLSGSWRDDASQTKSLAFDGCFITLYKLHLTRSNLVLREEVKKDIPSTWDPEGLARFIEKYGTHIIVAVSIGGQDVLYLKESHSSLLSTQDIHKHLKIAGDKCFSDGSGERSIDFKENEDMTIISRRRGGILSSKTHSKWQETVDSSPDAISFSFVPITSLISGASGSGFVQHAINIYLRYKPPVEKIRYFLDFQVPRQWIPVYNELPLGLSRKQALSLSLQFSLMGPKLYVNTLQVVVIKKPVTGVRLYLEGRKNNRLAIHLQHLSVLPKSLEQFWNENIPVEQPKWNGSNGAAKNWFEPVYWKSFSHVCTTPVKYKREWLSKKDTVFVVTGARLEVKMHGLASALHLYLLFTKIPECTIQTSRWDQPPASDKTRFCSSLSTTFSRTKKAGKEKATPVVMDSAVYPGGPPKPIQSQKLLKFVDMTELTKGPQDAPGHWIVTAARLELDRGKISMRVKYSLLNYS